MGHQRMMQTMKESTLGKGTTTAVRPMAPLRLPAHPLLRLQRAVGNRSVQRALRSEVAQTRLAVNEPGDLFEQEADRMAEQVMTSPAPFTSHRGGALLSSRGEGGHGGGQALPPSVRPLMESRFGVDFGGVRVHTDDEAAQMNRTLQAQAFTVGRHVYFGAGHFRPQSTDGRRLLAHELAHTVQQSSTQFARSGVFIQRQPANSQSAPAITARTIFPFPQGSRVALRRTMPDEWFNQISTLQPDVGAALRAIEAQAATVTTASDDVFEATLSNPVNLPAQGGRPAATLNKVTLSLRRRPNGTFDFDLSGRTDPKAGPTILYEQRNLTANAEGGGIVLSAGVGASAAPQLRVSPGASAEEARIEAFTAPFLTQLPDWVPDAIRRGIPQRLELIQMKTLTDVRPGTAAEQQAIRDISSSVASKRRLRRQRLTGGIGGQSAAQWDPFLSAAWQINFTPVRSVGTLLQVPLQVQLQYAPSASVQAGVSSGAEISLSQLNIPVNVRILAGVAAGRIQGTASEGSGERPGLGAFGPTLGVGAGLEIGTFRVNLTYERFWSLIGSAPNVDSFGLTVGKAL